MIGSEERIDFDRFRDFNIFRIKCIADGSCLIHSALQAFDKRYRRSTVDEKIGIVDRIRREMSILLEKVNINDDQRRIYYEYLGNGAIAELGSKDPEYSLESMKNLFNSRMQLGNETVELLQLILGKTIYVIYENSEDVYNYFYHPPDQNSICLYAIDGHYDLIGIMENSVMKTYFISSHPFISFLKRRLRDQVIGMQSVRTVDE